MTWTPFSSTIGVCLLLCIVTLDAAPINETSQNVSDNNLIKLAQQIQSSMEGKTLFPLTSLGYNPDNSAPTAELTEYCIRQIYNRRKATEKPYYGHGNNHGSGNENSYGNGNDDGYENGNYNGNSYENDNGKGYDDGNDNGSGDTYGSENNNGNGNVYSEQVNGNGNVSTGESSDENASDLRFLLPVPSLAYKVCELYIENFLY